MKTEADPDTSTPEAESTLRNTESMRQTRKKNKRQRPSRNRRNETLVRNTEQHPSTTTNRKLKEDTNSRTNRPARAKPCRPATDVERRDIRRTPAPWDQTLSVIFVTDLVILKMHVISLNK